MTPDSTNLGAAPDAYRLAQKFLGMVYPPDHFVFDSIGGAETPGVRDFLASLWKSALEDMPAVLEQLTYIARLRRPESGSYRHFGLELALGTEEANALIAVAHQRAFHAWISMSLVEQSAAVSAALASISADFDYAFRTWTRPEWIARMVPEGAAGHERALFLRDMAVVLRLLKNDRGRQPDYQEKIAPPPLSSAIFTVP